MRLFAVLVGIGWEMEGGLSHLRPSRLGFSRFFGQASPAEFLSKVVFAIRPFRHVTPGAQGPRCAIGFLEAMIETASSSRAVSRAGRCVR